MSYHITSPDGQSTLGPYSLDQLRAMWRSGAINDATLFWNDESTAWEPIDRLALKEEPVPPPLPRPVPVAKPRPVPVVKAANLPVKKRPIEVPGWFAFLVVLVAIFLFSLPLTLPLLKYAEEISRSRDSVRRELKWSPQRAVFSGLLETTVTRRGDDVAVMGWVDAENGFGATSRLQYTYTRNSRGWGSVKFESAELR